MKYCQRVIIFVQGGKTLGFFFFSVEILIEDVLCSSVGCGCWFPLMTLLSPQRFLEDPSASPWSECCNPRWPICSGMTIFNFWEPGDMSPQCLRYSSQMWIIPISSFPGKWYMVRGAEGSRERKQVFFSFVLFKILLCDHLEWVSCKLLFSLGSG